MASNSNNSLQTIEMLNKSNVFATAPNLQTHLLTNGIMVSIFVCQQSSQCEAYIQQKQPIIFKLENKAYTISSECKMDVKYQEGNTIEAIYLFASNEQIQFRSKEKGGLDLLYAKLKREVSHRGFNEFFKPLKRLGKGSFATVYLVQHKYTGEKLAAKVFSREGQKNQFMGHEALQNEIHMLKALNHPNIIRFEGIYETENLIYLVTEYLSGGTLVDFMRNKNKLIGDLATKIISDILKALKYLHENNIMHRDLKPQNIVMRDSDKEWVLVDFGIAAYTNKKFLYDKCGTMGYMAPQIMAQNQEEVSYTSSCDIYSLGVVAYILIIGCLPFKVEMQNFFQSKFIWNAFKKQQCIGLDEEILKLLKGLLQKQPSKRIKVQQALQSRFFTDPQVIQNWKDFNKIKKEQLYNKVLKSKDNSL